MYFSFIRLIIMPLIALLLCLLLKADALVSGVCVILTGMPAGTTTAILAEKYDGDAMYASECIFFSIILSLFSIPAMYYVIQMVF
jgi:predicted permease